MAIELIAAAHRSEFIAPSLLFLIADCRYQVAPLLEQCGYRLLQDISIDNVLERFMVSEQFGAMQLRVTPGLLCCSEFVLFAIGSLLDLHRPGTHHPLLSQYSLCAKDIGRLEQLQEQASFERLSAAQLRAVISAMTPSGGEATRKRSRGMFYACLRPFIRGWWQR